MAGTGFGQRPGQPKNVLGQARRKWKGMRSKTSIQEYHQYTNVKRRLGVIWTMASSDWLSPLANIGTLTTAPLCLMTIHSRKADPKISPVMIMLAFAVRCHFTNRVIETLLMLRLRSIFWSPDLGIYPLGEQGTGMTFHFFAK